MPLDGRRSSFLMALCLGAALLAPPVARAQWTPTGAPVCTATNSQITPSITADGSGGAFIAWKDSRSGSGGQYVQHVDAAGLPLWVANGVAVSTAASISSIVNVCSDGQGGVIAAWSDSRTGVSQIYVQRVNVAGVVKWATNGVALTSGTGGSSVPSIVYDTNFGAVVAWEGDPSNTGSSNILAQQVDSTGTPQWIAGGATVCNAGGNQSDVKVAVGSSFVFLVWTDARAGAGNSDIYEQRLLRSNGSIQWGSANGMPVCTQSGDQISPAFVMVGTTSYIAWQDNRSGVDVYAQSINSTGSPIWATDGVAVCTATGSQTLPALVVPQTANIFIAWQDARGGAENDIYYQRLNSSGVPQLAANGVAICSATGSQNNLVGVVDQVGGNGAIFAWRDPRNVGTGGDIYGQRVNSGGTLFWPANGAALCVATADQHDPAIALAETGVAFVAWQDERGQTDIYAQRAANDFLITSSQGPNGTITPLGTVTLTSGSSRSYTIAAIGNYHIGDVLVDGASVGAVASYSFTNVTANHTIAALFALNTQTIMATAGFDGQIAPAGAVIVTQGQSQTFAIVPNGAARIQDVLVDGVSRGAISSYRFTNVVTPHTIATTFTVVLADSGWTTNGAAGCTATGNQITPVVVSDGGGGVFVAWSDDRNAGNGSDLYMQHNAANGSALWGADGVPLATGINPQFGPQLVADGAGGVFAAWTDDRYGPDKAYVQHFDRDGMALWAGLGTALSAQIGTQIVTGITTDGAGGAIVSWGDTRGGDVDLYVQRVNSSGAPQWTVDGLRLVSGANDQSGPLVSDGAGGAFAVCYDNSGGSVDIRARRVDASGSGAWNAVTICNATSDQDHLAIAADDSGGVVIAWADRRGGTTRDIYVQRLYPSGARPWTANGVALCTASGDQLMTGVVSDSAGGAIVSWSDSRGASPDIYARRVSISGVPQWTADGVPLCTSAFAQSNPRIVMDGAKGAIVAWDDNRSGINLDVYAQRVNSAGSVQWAANGVALSTAPLNQSIPVIAPGVAGAIVAWQDTRSGGGTPNDIYAQRVSITGVVGFDHRITVTASAHGTVVPGTVGVFAGSSEAFVMTPDSAYHVSSVVVDSVARDSTTQFSFMNLAAGHTVAVTFAIDPLVTRIEPAFGGDRGPVTVQISGVGFQPGAIPALEHWPQPDIIASNVVVAGDGLSLSATFDLDGRIAGQWHVRVVNPDASRDTLSDAFTIESLETPQLTVHVLGPPLIRGNRRYPYDLVIENPGNIDAVNVPLWLTGVPADATLETDFAVAAPPLAAGEPDWTTVPQTFSSPGGRYLALVVPRVPPGTSVRRVFLTVPTTPMFKLRAAVTPPWADGNVFRSCLANGGIANPPCMGAQLTAINAYLAASPAIVALSGIGLWAKIAWQCEGAGTLPAALTKAEQVLDFMVGPVESPATAIAACSDVLPPRWRDSLTVTIVGSVDPNDKLGSRDPVAPHHAIPYSIRFENSPNATAPAQDVIITDPLDISVLDPATVSLGDITFGSYRIIPPPGLSSFAATVDMRPTRNIIVHVSVGIDPISHALGWSLTSTDPSGNPPPVNDGFLPANVTPPQGEGSVLFTVMPKATLPNGTNIHNHASIKFDDYPPTITNDWQNLLDTAPPSSHVLPLSVNSDLPSIPVSWAADGSPPDLRDFTVCVSEDGAPFRAWRLNVASSSDTLVPPGDHHFHSYSFYSLSRDMAGNIESVPVSADATTQSRTAVGDGAGATLALEGARPNPAFAAPIVWFTLPDRAPATLDLIDVSGRRVWRRDVGSLGPGTHSVVAGSGVPLAPGLYFLRLAMGERSLTARVAVMR